MECPPAALQHDPQTSRGSSGNCLKIRKSMRELTLRFALQPHALCVHDVRSRLKNGLRKFAVFNASSRFQLYFYWEKKDMTPIAKFPSGTLPVNNLHGNFLAVLTRT